MKRRFRCGVELSDREFAGLAGTGPSAREGMGLLAATAQMGAVLSALSKFHHPCAYRGKRCEERHDC